MLNIKHKFCGLMLATLATLPFVNAPLSADAAAPQVQRVAHGGHGGWGHGGGWGHHGGWNRGWGGGGVYIYTGYPYYYNTYPYYYSYPYYYDSYYYNYPYSTYSYVS